MCVCNKIIVKYIFNMQYILIASKTRIYIHNMTSSPNSYIVYYFATIVLLYTVFNTVFNK